MKIPGGVRYKSVELQLGDRAMRLTAAAVRPTVVNMTADAYIDMGVTSDPAIPRSHVVVYRTRRGSSLFTIALYPSLTAEDVSAQLPSLVQEALLHAQDAGAQSAWLNFNDHCMDDVPVEAPIVYRAMLEGVKSYAEDVQQSNPSNFVGDIVIAIGMNTYLLFDSVGEILPSATIFPVTMLPG